MAGSPVEWPHTMQDQRDPNETPFIAQLKEIVDERRIAAEKRQRDEPTTCGNVQHAGLTCREFDAFIRQQVDAGEDAFGSLASMIEQHQGYDPIL